MRESSYVSIGNPPKKCKVCGSANISSVGTRPNKGGRVKYYFCDDCGEYFKGEKVVRK